MSNKTYKAKLFAEAAHKAVGQVRKYTNQPYIVHPIEVAEIVKSVPHTDAMVAAAYLHDVLEDTKVTEQTLREEFGDEIADLVVWLTDISTKKDGNRTVRKALDREHLAQAPAEAQTVKLADLISNTKSIVKYDPEFAKTYLEEKLALLDVLTKGDKVLHARATESCRQYFSL
jgi:(p)ppGpp synthase/HD superfamily hydrolase